MVLESRRSSAVFAWASQGNLAPLAEWQGCVDIFLQINYIIFIIAQLLFVMY